MIKIKKNMILPTFCLLYLMISEILGSRFFSEVALFRYSDEIITLLILFTTFLYFICRKADAFSTKIYIIIGLIAGIGILSNILYNIQKNDIAILLDVLSTFKLIICFVGFTLMIKNLEIDKLRKFLLLPAKLFLVSGFIFGVLSLFYDLGMRGQLRFGLYGFSFIFGSAHAYAMMIISSVLIITTFNKTNKTLFIYLALACIQMVLSLKGPSFIWVVSIVLFTIHFQKYSKLKAWTIILLIGAGMIVGEYQINNYILNPNSPRARFYTKGFIVANRYFPLGSGFATFGSDMAGKNYSPLYDELGFNYFYGLSRENRMFLNDNYWPMIYAQFGWIGFFLYIYIYYMIYKKIYDIDTYPINKSALLSAYIYVMVHSLGSSTPTTSSACIVFLLISLDIEKVKKVKYNHESSNYI